MLVFPGHLLTSVVFSLMAWPLRTKAQFSRVRHDWGDEGSSDDAAKLFVFLTCLFLNDILSAEIQCLYLMRIPLSDWATFPNPPGGGHFYLVPQFLLIQIVPHFSSYFFLW